MSETRAANDDPLAYNLADRLHKALRIGKCKPGEMARILGVSSSTMTNYLSGGTRPKDGMLRQWALRCRTPDAPVTFGWLRDGTTPDPGDPGGLEIPGRAWNGQVLAFPTARATGPRSVAA